MYIDLIFYFYYFVCVFQTAHLTVAKEFATRQPELVPIVIWDSGAQTVVNVKILFFFFSRNTRIHDKKFF